MRSRGFTLIEVMVVLSILAIIAILAYNFFGGVMREATLTQQVAKLHNDLRIIADARMEYNRKFGVDITQGDGSELVSSGILKSYPDPDPAVNNSADGGVDYYFAITNGDLDGNGNGDAYAALWSTSTEACKAYNAKYAPSIGDAIFNWTVGDNMFATIGDEATFCYRATIWAAGVNNTVMLLERK